MRRAVKSLARRTGPNAGLRRVGQNDAEDVGPERTAQTEARRPQVLGVPRAQ